MKFLIVFPSAIRGGAEEYALTIASAAVKKGWQVHAAFPQTEETQSLIQDFQDREINYHFLDIALDKGLARLKEIEKYLPQLFRSIALLIKLKPDVILLNIPYPDLCLGPLLASGILQIPTVVRFALFPPFRFLFSKKMLNLYSWARSKNQQWIALSENNRRLICESFEISRDKLLLIYNGTKIQSDLINLTPNEVTQLRYQVRQEFGFSETSKLLLTVARLNIQKGYFDLVPVIAPIVGEFPEIKFIWVGDGEQREELVQEVKECGVEDNVLFLGYRSDVSRLLKSADLFVFPTRFEGLASAPLEAMAHGLPIISSDASSMPEVIENKVHGLLFPTGDSQALLETIRWALKHPDAMEEMAEKAKLRVQDFSEDRMIKETLEVLENTSRQ